MEENSKKQANDYVQLDSQNLIIDYGIDGNYEQVEEVDSELRQDEKSDNAYQKTADKIVNISNDQLDAQRKMKDKAKSKLLNFFIALLFIQFLSIVAIVVLKGLRYFDISDSVLIVYITSVFVETLGVIAIMVKSSFNSAQEIEIIKILNSYIKDFKVYNSSEHRGENNNNDDKNGI